MDVGPPASSGLRGRRSVSSLPRRLGEGRRASVTRATTVVTGVTSRPVRGRRRVAGVGSARSCRGADPPLGVDRDKALT
ncbi:hypothetical protein NL676_021912 [Syzygium grande]|nr:hypothetical protein NL676_021912 [Syzygium grande]